MDIMQMQAALNGYSLVDPSEAAVTPGSSSLTVDVAGAPSGVRLGGPAESFSGETGVSLPSPDPDQPRKVLVYLGGGGNVQVFGGDPADPVPSGEIRTKTGVPTLPIPAAGFLPLAEVWMPAGATDITASDIFSRRMPFEQGQGSGLNADLLRGKQLNKPPLYGNGSDGEVIINSNTSDSGMLHTTRYEIQAGNTLTLNDSALIIFAREEIVIDGTIDGSAVNGGGEGGFDDDGTPGSDGATAMIGASGTGGPTSTGNGIDGGPGAGGSGSGDDSARPGGSGGDANVSIDRQEHLNMYPSTAYDLFFDQRILGGSAGGGGGQGADNQAYGGDGGNGGGGVLLIAPAITINGTINLDAGDGEDGSVGRFGDAGGGGGGGSGGLLVLVGETITDNSTFSATAGIGGIGPSDGEGLVGGDGGDGLDGQKVIIESP